MGILFGYPTPLDGKSAYEIAVDNGYVGTEQQWLISLIGAQGPQGIPGTNGANGLSAYEIWLQNGHTGSEADFLNWIGGNAGLQAIKGVWTSDLQTNCTLYDGRYIVIGDLVTISGKIYKPGAGLAEVHLPAPYDNYVGGKVREDIGQAVEDYMNPNVTKDEKHYYATFLKSGGKSILQIESDSNLLMRTLQVTFTYIIHS